MKISIPAFKHLRDGIRANVRVHSKEFAMRLHHLARRLSDVTSPSWDNAKYICSVWRKTSKFGRKFPRLHYLASGEQRKNFDATEKVQESKVGQAEVLSAHLRAVIRPPTNRASFFDALRGEQGLGLEVGPLHAPICRRETHNVRYVDTFSTEELKAHYDADPNVPTNLIVEVDYVWKGESYRDLISERFDFVVSSHNIEHVPCLITFLNNLSSCLHTGGKVYFAIPDKRYCFDHFKPESSLAEVLDAQFTKRQQPSPWHILRHELLVTHNNSAEHWKGEHGVPAYMVASDFVGDSVIPANSMAGAYSTQKRDSSGSVLTQLEKYYSESRYHDTHVWIMTPFSFGNFVDFLTAHKLISLRITELFPTEEGSHEFYAVIEKI